MKDLLIFLAFMSIPFLIYWSVIDLGKDLKGKR